MATRAPSRASSVATARPRPLLAPATAAGTPLRPMSIQEAGAALLCPGDPDRKADPGNELRRGRLTAAPAPDELLEQAFGLMGTEELAPPFERTLELPARGGEQ